LVPTLIINKIKSKLIGPKFIINVGSYEGQFEIKKNDKHIHTNMCKTAMNMLIRSLEEDPDTELHVHSINPGYITGIKKYHSFNSDDKNEQEYPLKPEDGASRITWPIFQFSNGIKLDKSWTKIGNYQKAKW
jgi:NADP-dependent 3-hydroxy acid dehydrogenase YdfG